MEPYLFCVFFWVVLAILALAFERTANDISENNIPPDWSLIQLLILILVIIVVAYYFIVLDSGEICIGVGQTCSG